MSESFPIGSLVWGKMKNYPHWPGEIVKWPRGLKNPTPKKKKKMLCVRFFGLNKHVLLEPSDIQPYEQNKNKFKKHVSAEFNEAIEDMESYIRNSDKVPVMSSYSLEKVPPISDCDFRNLIEHGVYIDKTEYLNKLFKSINNYFVMIKPRRFGKSLFVRTIETFFSGEASLFTSLYIYKENPEYTWEKYPIIRLEFGGMNSKSGDIFSQAVAQTLRVIGLLHEITLISTESTICLIELIKKMKIKYGKKVVVLVDDYDSPLVNCPDNEYANIAGELKIIFSTLKSNCDCIRLCFVTGITNIALSTVFSGFNNALRLGPDPEFAASLGFTEAEIRMYLKAPIENVAYNSGMRVEEVYDEIKKWYNGYRFTRSTEKVINPCSLFLYLSSETEEKRFWSLSGGSSFLKKQIKKSSYFTLSLATRRLLSKPQNENRDTEFKVLESDLFGEVELNPSTEYSWAILFYQIGIFTISSWSGNKDNRKYTLKFTNEETLLFYLHILSSTVVEQYVGFDDFTRHIKETICLEQWDSFVNHVNTFLANFPHTLFDFEKSTECVFQLIMYILMGKLEYQVDLDVMTSTGRVDLVANDIDHALLFEFKIENNNKEDPLTQCEKYHQAFLNKNIPIICFGIQFKRKTRKIIKFGVSKYTSEGETVYRNETVSLEE